MSDGQQSVRARAVQHSMHLNTLDLGVPGRRPFSPPELGYTLYIMALRAFSRKVGAQVAVRGLSYVEAIMPLTRWTSIEVASLRRSKQRISWTVQVIVERRAFARARADRAAGRPVPYADLADTLACTDDTDDAGVLLRWSGEIAGGAVQPAADVEEPDVFTDGPWLDRAWQALQALQPSLTEIRLATGEITEADLHLVTATATLTAGAAELRADATAATTGGEDGDGDGERDDAVAASGARYQRHQRMDSLPSGPLRQAAGTLSRRGRWPGGERARAALAARYHAAEMAAADLRQELVTLRARLDRQFAAELSSMADSEQLDETLRWCDRGYTLVWQPLDEQQRAARARVEHVYAIELPVRLREAAAYKVAVTEVCGALPQGHEVEEASGRRRCRWCHAEEAALLAAVEAEQAAERWLT